MNYVKYDLTGLHTCVHVNLIKIVEFVVLTLRFVFFGCLAHYGLYM